MLSSSPICGGRGGVGCQGHAAVRSTQKSNLDNNPSFFGIVSAPKAPPPAPRCDSKVIIVVGGAVVLPPILARQSGTQ